MRGLIRYRRSGRGFALIAILFLLVMGVLFFAVEFWNPSSLQRKQVDATTLALAQAKEALFGWSVADNTAPGRLPCPEDTSKIGTGLEGQAQAACSNVAPSIGRLPWRTLRMQQLRDGYGEPLWYVLSPGFRLSPINTSTAPQLAIDGAPAIAAAIVFAPGFPSGNQSRSAITAANPPLLTDYLDLSNNDGNTTFVTSGDPATFNDRLLAVRADELLSTVAARIAGEVRGYPGKGLQGYFDIHNFLPCAAVAVGGPQSAGLTTGYFPLADPDISFDAGTMNLLNDNNWFNVISYSAPSCGTVAATTATVTIGSKIVSLQFP